jgi:hypothetical protein
VQSNLTSGLIPDRRVAWILLNITFATFIVLYCCLSMQSNVRSREQKEVIVLVSVVMNVYPVHRLAVELREKRIVAVLIAFKAINCQIGI